MSDYTFSLNQPVSFTGTSASTNSQGNFIGLVAAEVSHDHTGGPLQVEFFGFNFSYPSGPSTMGLDLLLQIDGVDQGPFQRFIPAARVDPTLRRFAWVSPSLQAGTHVIRFSARGVLFGGPPIAVQIVGDATLRLTAKSKIISFSSPGPQSFDAGSSFTATLGIASPEPTDITVNLASRNGFVSLQPLSTTIPAGATTSEPLTISGTTGGSDFVTATANDFQSVPLAVNVRPVLSSLSPLGGPEGTIITLLGEGFDSDAAVIQGNSGVRQAIFNSPTSLSITISGFNEGAIDVAVIVNDQQSQSLTFQVLSIVMSTDQELENWPGNRTFRAPLYLVPKNLAELAAAIRQAERAGHHVRAHGSFWSFSDAVFATTGSPPRPGAMIATEYLSKILESELPSIVAAGVDPTSLCHVEAGTKADALTALLAQRGQMLEAGGASGQSIAGMMSTSTHSADSLVRPFVDYVRAIHLVGAGGIEHWLEPDSGITDPAKLQAVYPRLAAGNIHYDTRLFNAVLVSAGSMGVIYSVIIKTVPQYGVHQHRVATTWESLLAADPDLTKVIDGTYLASRSHIPPEIDVLGDPILMSAPFTPNTFSQVVINPYPLYGNDATLTTQEQIHIGEHLCFVTNRVEIPVPATPYNPGSPDSIQSMGEQMGLAARRALGFNVLDYDVRFLNFQNSLIGVTDVNKTAPALVEFLADNFEPRTISAVIHFVLRKILPVEDRFAVNLSEVVVWDDKIKSFCVEAAFTVSGALAFVPKVLALVASYAARNPRIYIGGYLALRIVGKNTDALLGMQRWSPTCCVEYLGLAGSRGIDEFADDLQKLALASDGILHFGLQNNVMTAADMLKAYGPANIEAFRRARGILSQNGTLTTFDNTFTDRLGLSALPDPVDGDVN